VAFSPDSRRLAAVTVTPDRRGELQVWDPATGAGVLRLEPHGSTISDIAYAPASPLLVTCDDATITLWDATAGQPVKSWPVPPTPFRRLAFSPGGRHLASSGSRDGLRVWELATGEEVFRFAGQAGGEQPNVVAFSPAGGLLAFDDGRANVLLYDVATWQRVRALKLETRTQATGLAFSPDGGRLACAGLDRTVRVWAVASGWELHRLSGHTAMVTDVAFSPDGTRLASAGHDDTVRIWDADSGLEILTLWGHGQLVQCVAFSPDGRWLASSGRDGTVRVWDARPLDEGGPGPSERGGGGNP
jgi:WD40 repeat protein